MVVSEKFLIPILTKMVQINTENPDGRTNEIVEYLQTVFPEEKGFRKKIITNTKNGIELQNLVVELGTGKQKIVLCGHLDTVPVGKREKWKVDPLSGEIIDGILFGRGSADMKGGVASLIGVMFNFLENETFLEEYTIVFLGTADEEAGMSGAEALAKDGIMENAILLIIPEATNLSIGIAEKGVIWAKVKTIGKAAHGSMPDQGLNAIESLVNLFPEFHNCISANSNKILGKSTLNIGTIIGGDKINIVPSEATVELDYRLVPEENMEQTLTKIKNLKGSPCDLEVEFVQILPPLLSQQDNKFIQNLKNITKTELIGLTYGTDAAKLINHDNPIPFVIFGPGDSNIIHQSNEFVPIKQVLEVAKRISEALIKTYLD